MNNWTDFEFDDLRLSDFDSTILCVTNGGGSVDAESMGNELTLNTARNLITNANHITSTQYDEVYTLEFEIAKTGCNGYDTFYTENDVQAIVRWLNRKEYCHFKKIFQEDVYQDIYYVGTFTSVQKIMRGYDVVGFKLTFTSKTPYAYYDEVSSVEQNIDETDSIVVDDISDEVCKIYPYVKIKVGAAGNLKLYNTHGGHKYETVVNNCVANEVIEFSGETKQVTSSVQHNKLLNDFNYYFPTIYNDYTDTLNEFTANMSCEISLSYSPICKAVL